MYGSPEKDNRDETVRPIIVSNHYLEAVPFLEFLIENRLVKGGTEGDTSAIWNNILWAYFTARDNYAIGPETFLSSRGVSLSVARFIPENNWEELTFFNVACMGPGLEAEETIWEDAAAQLGKDLAGISGKHRKYGAVAVGRYIRFYEWKGGKLFSIADSQTFRLDRQSKAITDQLLYFRENQ
ncbi:hypothetical protein F4821DRAFT_236124 [Hypoxylon rubiginosum]|uniref:Uncharacterized protein n=1 Tax=Hypoxylon rubiginosum TaxID=110542 RepID=A0ACC0D4S7_9PEZI|nr:hypothetical protein F4821DRAFT_236124 [Hypoxylon rubiginosum]